jgi:hypothetical protein
MKLLSDEGSNAKLAKNAAALGGDVGAGVPWRTSILYLAPADVAVPGVSLCPASTPGCRAACLYTAGRGAMSTIQTARVRKARRFIRERFAFMADLATDLERLVRRQRRTGVRQAVRLNGTSDIRWEFEPIQRAGVWYSGVPQAFPELQFYDYTKIPGRAVPENYHLTLSASEATQHKVARWAPADTNIAVVFAGPTLPDTWLGRPVIDGTTHDARFTDPKGVVVGLLPKGRARVDRSGFVVHNTQEG